MSLLRKIGFLFFVTFLFASVVFYYVLDSFYEKEEYKTIKQNVLLSEAMQEYVSLFQKPAVYNLMKEYNISKEYFNPALLSSTFIIKHVDNIFQKNILKEKLDITKIEFKFASDNPTNPSNKANDYESKVLKKFNESNITSYSERVKRNNKDYFFFALPTRKNTKKCLKCHGNYLDAPKDMLKQYGNENGYNEKVGYIRSINAIYSEVDKDNDMLRFYSIVEALMLVIFLSIYLTVRYFIMQLNKKDILIAKQSRFAALGEMISMIAHQWKQPLTGMSMTTNNLLLDIELQDIDEKRWGKNLELINKQINYLSHTIDDFKNFFKPNTKSEMVDINSLITESCQIISSTLKNNNIIIEQNYSKGVSIMIKKNDVMQIILNLVKNSMDAYKENKIKDRVIKISTSANYKNVKIIVKDQAGGIADEIVEKIFDPYFSTKDDKNGTGLGLYMSKMIIEDHLQGNLSVQTENSSTIFTITLPKKRNYRWI